MRYRNATLCLLALLLAACKPSAPPATEALPSAAGTDVAPAAQSPAAAAPAPAPAATSAVDAVFAKGMPYAEVRRRLLEAGWLPLRDPACRENVGGEARVCGVLPEVESCSGDGHCVMHFANAGEGQRMRITAYGPYDRWNTPGEQVSFGVQSWERSPVAAAAATACPAQDFETFLQRFAADEAIERAFTAPLVKVAELGGGEDGDDTVMTYQSGGAYDQFILMYRDGKWHIEPSEGTVASAPIEIAVRAEPAGAHYVSIPGNVEGISYLFERRGDCWQLTSDPDVVP